MQFNKYYYKITDIKKKLKFMYKIGINRKFPTSVKALCICIYIQFMGTSSFEGFFE